MEKCKKETKLTESNVEEKKVKAKKNMGIIFTVVGGAVGLWVYARVTSLAGQFHSWQPPFTEYEGVTLVGAGIAIILIVCGLGWITTKK